MTFRNASESLAFDKSTLRSTDQDGRLRVELSHMSKAMVCPYMGHEIPGHEELGLDPGQVYHLFRDPDELAKSVPTWNSVPVLNEHIAVSADDHKPDSVVGATGTDAQFNAPYLDNSMVIWVKDSIDAIESGSQREISCSYYYDPDMSPGTFNGEKYDGVMRNIRGNHVALVEKGRAGPDVLVNDSIFKNEVKTMSDLKLAKNIVLDAAKKKKMAKDADIQSVIDLLDRLDKEDMDDDNLGSDDMDPKCAAIMKVLEGKLSPEDMEAVKSMMMEDKPAAVDEPAQTANAANADPKDGENKEVIPAKDDDDTDMVMDKEEDEEKMKAAMDKAIKLACDATEKRTIERLRGISEAEEAVRPYVGKLKTAMDSAEDVYKEALSVLKVDVKGVHPSAYRHILMAQANPSEAKKSSVTVAQDADISSDIFDAFPALRSK